jgi:hypothetical protein
MTSDAEVEDVIALFKLGYERAVAQATRRSSASGR